MHTLADVVALRNAGKKERTEDETQGAAGRVYRAEGREEGRVYRAEGRQGREEGGGERKRGKREREGVTERERRDGEEGQKE